MTNQNQEILSIIERETGQRVSESTLLESLGVDSLEFLDLLLAIGDATGKEVPFSKIGDLKTVGDIVEDLC